MRRTFVLAIAVAICLTAAPAIAAGPNAVEWVETDEMGAEFYLAAPRMAGDWMHMRYERHGEFTAQDGDGFSHAGYVGWTAAGKMKLDETHTFPVFGTFRAKGYYEFTEGPKEGVTCDLTLQSKLVESPGAVPPFVFYGNQVAHCTDGSKIHGRILGPTAAGSEPMGFLQTVTGTLQAPRGK